MHPIRVTRGKDGESVTEIDILSALAGGILVLITLVGNIPWEYKALAWIFYLDIR